MKTNNALLILFAAFLGWCGTMNAQKAGLEKRMENADPKVIGTRIVNKFLVTPHTRFGNPRARKHPIMSHIRMPVPGWGLCGSVRR